MISDAVLVVCMLCSVFKKYVHEANDLSLANGNSRAHFCDLRDARTA